MDLPVFDLIQEVVRSQTDRVKKTQKIAEAIRSAWNYRWVGIYDVSDDEVSVIAWSGPAPPAFPRFPVSQGLNGAAVSSRKTVIVNDVSHDSRYLTTLDSTQAEMVVPVIAATSGRVVGTIDAESVRVNAFSEADRLALETCARVILPLWV